MSLLDVGVYIAMSEEQAAEEHCVVCFEELPDRQRLYSDMIRLLDDLIKSGTVQCLEDGWRIEVNFSKKDAQVVFACLHPEGIPFDYEKSLDRIHGDTVRLIGFGD